MAYYVSEELKNIYSKNLQDAQIASAQANTAAQQFELENARLAQSAAPMMAEAMANAPEPVKALLRLGLVEPAMKVWQEMRLQEQQAQMGQLLGGLGGLGGADGGEDMAGGGADMATRIAMASVATGNTQLMNLAQFVDRRNEAARQEARDIEREKRGVARDIEKEARDPSVESSKSFGFANRMMNAATILDNPDYVKALTDPVLSVAGGVWSGASSPKWQAADRAKLDWLTANLRKETGANVPKEEYGIESQKYFPRPGDSKEVIAEKAKARKIAENSMKVAAGSLWNEKGSKQEVIPPTKGGIPKGSVGGSFKLLGVE